MANDSAYNDEPTAEELALLASAEASSAVPPAEDDDSNPILPAQVAEEAGLDPATGKPPVTPPDAAPAPAAPAAPAGTPPAGQTDDEKFAAFMEANKGKTPEELAKIAWQQSQRANQNGFAARQTKEALERISGTISAISERRAAIAEKRSKFEETLASDPDAAARDVNERLLTQEESDLAAQERQVRQEQMLTVAATAIPDFHAQAPAIHQFAGEMNYTPEELDAMTDPRDMVTLYLASVTGRMMRAGILDLRGNFLKMPTAVEQTDPRLSTTAPVITTLGTAPARTATGAQSIHEQLAAYNALSDKDMEAFDKANPGMIDNLLRQAG